LCVSWKLESYYRRQAGANRAARRMTSELTAIENFHSQKNSECPA
jgi:hypothetical protein